MRLHTLRVTAIGPFAEEETIDFDRLSAGGLFLFEGPTGVGKSTILDAVTFALYGGLASDSGDLARMRSDFADPQARPEVELEFSVRGARYRITRSPEYARPKVRGVGVTREKSSVHLQRREEAGWHTLTHAKDEAGLLVTELMGLNREQFRQVVLLPQGEFATFLRADDERRRDVLARLFGTEFFRRVADQLQERARVARTQLASARSDASACVAAALEAAGAPDPERETMRDLPVDVQVPRLEELADELCARRIETAREADVAEATAEQVRQALAQAERVVELALRRRALEQALEALEHARPEHEVRAARLADADRAEPVRPLLELASTVAQRLERASHEAVVAGVTGVDAAGPAELATWDQTGRALRREADALAALVEAESAMEAAAAWIREKEAQTARLSVACEEAGRRLDKLPGELLQARASLHGVQRTADSLAAAQEKLHRATESRALLERLDQLGEELIGVRREHRLARRAYDATTHEAELLAQQRLASVRGELARQLVNGDPCLVCGSIDHPAPASEEGAAVSEEAMRQALRACDEERVRLTEAELALARLEGERQSLAASCGDATTADAENQVREARAALDAATEAQASLAGLEDRIQALEDERLSAQARRLALAEEIAIASGQLEAHRAEAARTALEVERARAGHPSVAQRVGSLIEEADRRERHATALRKVLNAREEHETILRRAAAEAAGVGFADLAAARSAVLDREQRAELRSQIERWTAEVASARAQLTTPELDGVADEDPDAARAHVGTVRAQGEAADAEASSARRAATVAERQAERFAQRLAEVITASHQLAQLAEECEAIVSLDLYARGMAGSPRMTLVTYVLRHWFEKVVAAANLRLDAMSAGKYQLIRTDQGARRDSRVGLGLAVLDRHTGRERSPATLSGGETFYTSLALALGLADVVVAEAGGAQLDTLFIDEGFGSLDPETLEDVMGVIDDLRGNGRVVGIVSHVPDLKERIAERLSVRRVRPDGPSTIRVLA